jgi:hypothetical protein
MKSRLLVWLLLSFLLGCASISSVRSLPLANREFPAGNGTFIFRDVVLDGTTLLGSWNIKGFVRNHTDQDWKRVQFDFQLYDETGNTLKNYIDSNITFTSYLLMNRDEHSCTTNYFKILPKPNSVQEISKYEITYKDIYRGKQIFIMVKPWENRERFFEDQSIKILFSVSEKQIGIILHNKMNAPIRVDWNNISYVDITGLAHGVVHTGVRYIERDRPQVPTVIPPAAMIEDAIIPSDHISYTPGSGGGWSARALFSASKETNLNIGKLFSVFMPLELDGAVKNYSFSFRIEHDPT